LKVKIIFSRKEPVVVEEELFESVVSRCIEGMRERHLTVSWGDRLLTLDKSASFMEEPCFLKAYEAIYGSHKYDQLTVRIRLPGDLIRCAGLQDAG